MHDDDVSVCQIKSTCLLTTDCLPQLRILRSDGTTLAATFQFLGLLIITTRHVSALEMDER